MKPLDSDRPKKCNYTSFFKTGHEFHSQMHHQLWPMGGARVLEMQASNLGERICGLSPISGSNFLQNRSRGFQRNPSQKKIRRRLRKGRNTMGAFKLSVTFPPHTPFTGIRQIWLLLQNNGWWKQFILLLQSKILRQCWFMLLKFILFIPTWINVNKKN